MELERAIEIFNENKRLSLAYNHALGVMSFDSETVAPKNSAAGRGRTYEVLSELVYKLNVNERYFEALDTMRANFSSLDRITQREVEEEEHSLEQLRNIPMEEYTAHQGLLAEAQSAWIEAKEKSEFSIFAPYLEKIVAYNRRVASLVRPDMDAYDFWLNEFERGLNRGILDEFFGRVRASLVPLISEIRKKGDVIRTDFLSRSCPLEAQRRFSDYLMEVLHIDRGDCAIAETEHPFTTNFNKHDVRITTHYHENAMVSSMYSVIHEGGHALYELNTGDELEGTLLAGGASMGIHESQSRFYENIIGRSEGFIELVFPKLRELFPEQLGDVTPHEFFLAVNRAEPSLIRTEADELTYSLHIMVRYEIEKKLMNGEISVSELPAEWNRLYKEYLGVDVPSDREGVLQDMHWAGGAFGYFPSYALGSAYGAQMLAKMKREHDIDAMIRENRIDKITEILKEKIYKYGMLLTPAELIESACGEGFDAKYFIDYLTEKYGNIYGL